eukprot:TRINITY_DN443_c1_g8_i1.p1 TRINITY_DN443_c1_g8~~TRINITY_DN443_c1_g8_i1.p1  ORF type:complete len:399 (-),score=62.90 TRINITY_DN443_c1_g8_i1:37-1233(-)
MNFLIFFFLISIILIFFSIILFIIFVLFTSDNNVVYIEESQLYSTNLVRYLYFKLIILEVKKLLKKEKEIKKQEKIEIRMKKKIKINGEKLKKYNEFTKLKSEQSMIYYLYTLFGTLQLMLVSNKNYLFPVFGSVHVNNKMNQYVEIDPENDELILVVTLEMIRNDKKGIKMILHNKIYKELSNKEDVRIDYDQINNLDEYILVWDCVTTGLTFTNKKLVNNIVVNNVDVGEKIKSYNLSSRKVVNEFISEIENDNDFYFLNSEKLASNLGRNFASICNDYNPIHLHHVFAKYLFGMRTAIAHGMMIFAKNLNQLEKHDDVSYPFGCNIFFIGKAYLGSTVDYYSKNNNDQEELEADNDDGESNDFKEKKHSISLLTTTKSKKDNKIIPLVFGNIFNL